MKLSVLLKGTGIKTGSVTGRPDIHGLAYNSLEVENNYLFIAIQGFRTDGHKYIKNAIDNGAVLIIIENKALLRKYNIPIKQNCIIYKEKQTPFIIYNNNRLLLSKLSANFYHHPSKKIKLIGITGTNGKTTTAYLIENLLKCNGYKVGLIGTINYRIGKKIIKSAATTPESLELHALLAEMAIQKADYVIMEVSSHSLALHRVDDCHFDQVVFTNLTEDHFDFHGDFNNYFKAKRKLFELLLKSEKKRKNGLLNIDDIYGRRLYRQFKKIRGINLYRYSTGKVSDISAKDIHIDLNKIKFNLTYKNRTYKIKSNLLGLFNAYNILAAIGTGIIEKIPVSEIIKSIAVFKKVPGRLEIIRAKDFSIGIDYAHTEDALENVLKTVKELHPERIITIFGCGGDRDKKKRPLMGKVAVEYSDYTIITSDNPRSENPTEIIKDIEYGIKKKRVFNMSKLLIERKPLKKDYLWLEKEIFF